MAKYLCKIRKGYNIPWGYEQDPDDYYLFLPIEEQLDAYEKAKEYIKQGCSYRDTATWLSETTGRPISASGLFLKIRDEKRAARSEIGKAAWKRKFGTEEGSAASTEEEAEEA